MLTCSALSTYGSYPSKVLLILHADVSVVIDIIFSPSGENFISEFGEKIPRCRREELFGRVSQFARRAVCLLTYRKSRRVERAFYLRYRYD